MVHDKPAFVILQAKPQDQCITYLKVLGSGCILWDRPDGACWLVIVKNKQKTRSCWHCRHRTYGPHCLTDFKTGYMERNVLTSLKTWVCIAATIYGHQYILSSLLEWRRMLSAIDFKTGYVERSIPTNVNSYIITDWFFFFRESLTVWLPGEVSGWSNYFSAQQDFLFSSVHEPTPTLRKIGSCKDLVCKENHEILFVPSLAICFEIPSVTFRM